MGENDEGIDKEDFIRVQTEYSQSFADDDAFAAYLCESWSLTSDLCDSSSAFV